MDFLEAFHGQVPLDAAHLIAAVRGFTVTCLEQALRSRQVPDRDLQRMRRRALERHMLDTETARHFSDTTDLTLGGFRFYFKAFSENFQPFERVMGWSSGGGVWCVAIRIGLRPGEDGAGLYQIGPVAVGLMRWSRSGSAHAELEELQVPLAREWSQLGVTPRQLDAEESGEQPFLGTAWRPSDWTGTAAELIEMVASLLLGAMRAAESSPELIRAEATAERPDPLEGENLAATLAEHLAAKGYRFTAEQVATFYSALKAKGFVILSGLSGTGKTKLAQELAALLLRGRGEKTLLEPVRPDWRDSTGLLGYWNPVTRQYEAGRFMRHVLAAAAEYRGETAPVSDTRLREFVKQNLHSVTTKTRIETHWEALQRVRSWRGAWTSEHLSFLWRERDNGVRLVRGEMTVGDEVLRRATEILGDQSMSLARRIDEALGYLKRSGEPGVRRVQVARVMALLEPENALPFVVRKTLRWAARGLDMRLVIRSQPEIQRWADIENAWRLLHEAIQPLLAAVGENGHDPVLRAAAIELVYKYIRHQEGATASEGDVDDDDESSTADPYFIILDEMNLARVEYYLADVLSVVETGRIGDGPDEGCTRGEISLHGQSEEVRLADGTVIPRSLRLPPNLYIIGTVNMDETTFAFSPKVLDRAFTIEFRTVDLTGYPPAMGDGAVQQAREIDSEALLADFTRQGRFVSLRKEEISAWGQGRQGLVSQLQALNAALMEYDLGFGYRVVDEILAFVGCVAESPMAEALPEPHAFDAAVMMKVLPKFHGPLHRMEKPLESVLEWAGQGDDVRYPRTSRKAARMLRQAQETGYTSFS